MTGTPGPVAWPSFSFDWPDPHNFAAQKGGPRACAARSVFSFAETPRQARLHGPHQGAKWSLAENLDVARMAFHLFVQPKYRLIAPEESQGGLIGSQFLPRGSSPTCRDSIQSGGTDGSPPIRSGRRSALPFRRTRPAGTQFDAASSSTGVPGSSSRTPPEQLRASLNLHSASNWG
jgi:hypothetical protein